MTLAKYWTKPQILSLPLVEDIIFVNLDTFSMKVPFFFLNFESDFVSLKFIIWEVLSCVSVIEILLFVFFIF